MNIRERIIDLTEEQVDIIESKLDEYDKKYIHYKLDGRIQIGIEEDGKLVAGLDACMTAFKILYVSTVFVDENYRGKGYKHGINSDLSLCFRRY